MVKHAGARPPVNCRVRARGGWQRETCAPVAPFSMQPNFKVSVATPVYNAGPFVRRAVEAAVSQPEGGDVILVEDCLVEDGSPHNYT